MNTVLFFNALKEEGNMNTMIREVFEGLNINIYICVDKKSKYTMIL